MSISLSTASCGRESVFPGQIVRTLRLFSIAALFGALAISVQAQCVSSDHGDVESRAQRALRDGGYPLAKTLFAVEVKRSDANYDYCAEAIAQIGLGNTERALGRHVQALDHFRRVITLLVGPFNDPYLVANALHDLGNTEYALGHYDSARAHLSQAFANYESSGSSSIDAANVLIDLGNTEIALDQLDGARAAFDAARTRYGQVFSRSLSGQALASLGLAAVETHAGHKDAAQQHFADAAKLFRKTGMHAPKHMAILRSTGLQAKGSNDNSRMATEQILRDLEARLDHRALTMSSLERFEVAIALRTAALDIAQKRAAADRAASLYSGLGEIARRMDQLGAARQYFAKSQALYAKIADTQGDAGAREDLGALAWQYGYAGAALVHARAAQRLYAKLGATTKEAASHMLVADALFVAKRYDEAKQHFNAALALHKAEAVREQAEALYGLADVASAQGKLEEARLYILDAREIYRKSDQSDGDGKGLEGMGRFELRIKQPALAYTYFSEIIELFQYRVDDRRRSGLLDQLAEAERLLGKYDQALKHFAEARDLHLGRENSIDAIDSYLGLVKTEIALGHAEEAENIVSEMLAQCRTLGAGQTEKGRFSVFDYEHRGQRVAEIKRGYCREAAVLLTSAGKPQKLKVTERSALQLAAR
jgi:tetratricopeptide (TPR) repeat protein